MSILASTSSASTAAGWGGMIIWLVVLFGFMYFFMIRPQQKEAKKKNAMLSELAVGDTVLTTSGFYGTVIDIADDTVIVEFGKQQELPYPDAESCNLRSGETGRSNGEISVVPESLLCVDEKT